MENARGEISRLLCASAILLGREYRRIIIDRASDNHQAVAPELGLDASLLLQVCVFLEALPDRLREINNRYRWWFIGILVMAIIVAVLARSSIAFVVVLALFAWPVQFIALRARQVYDNDSLLRYFTRYNYNPEQIAQQFSIDVKPKLKQGVPDDNQNLVVYSGFSPFVGAGWSLGGWSFAVNLTEPRQNAAGNAEELIPFDIFALYDHLDAGLKQLDFQELTVKDMLYINGYDIRDDRTLLPSLYDRPVQFLDAERAKPYIAGSDQRIRHYKWVQLYHPSESMVVSFFLRCSIRGSSLFYEVSRFLLTPPVDAYTEVDRHNLDEDDGILRAIAGFLGELLLALMSAPFAAIVAPFSLLAPVSRWVGQWISNWFERRREKRLNEAIEYNLQYDFGADSSIRERIQQSNYAHYFQMLDKEMYIKIVERAALDSILEFLEDHNVDTSEFKERRTTILNSGVIIQGGNLETQNLAVGEGAQATQTNTEQSSRGESA